MRQVLNVNILEDKRARNRVMLLAIPATLVGYVLLGYAVGEALASDNAAFPWGWLLGVVAGLLVSLPVHELIHGAFFKLFGPRGTKVTFGYSNGMLYAGCPGVWLKPWQFVVVLLAPLVVLTCVYVVVGLVLGDWLAAGILVLLHAGGCSGDLWFVWLIARHPETTRVEDTSTGMLLLAESDNEPGAEGPLA